MTVRFYIGLSRPADARHFPRACVSIHRLRGRRRPIECPEILIDSGAFSELALHGRYRHSVGWYAAEIARLVETGVVHGATAVAQDFMCEPFVVRRTGLSLVEHQRLTIERFDELVGCNPPLLIMPVVQGYRPAEYAAHVRAYGDRLRAGMWVGVGSVCKRNGDPSAIIEVLSAIHAERPDLRLHGFGIKRTAISHAGVRALLFSADSHAWSYAARRQGRDRNAWTEAKAFATQVEAMTTRRADPWQMPLPLWRDAA